jgi:hypothetical protein
MKRYRGYKYTLFPPYMAPGVALAWADLYSHIAACGIVCGILESKKMSRKGKNSKLKRQKER